MFLNEYGQFKGQSNWHEAPSVDLPWTDFLHNIITSHNLVLCFPLQAGLKQYASTTGSLNKAPLASESLLGLQAYGRQVRCQGLLPL